MPGNIKGITIEFRGDTTPLTKALNTIKKESNMVDKELREVNRALKFNPNNVELMRQKFTLLGQKVDATEDQIKQLRATEKQLKAQNVSKQSTEWMKVRREIIEAESKLKHFKAEMKSLKFANLNALGNSFKNAGAGMQSAGMYASVGAGAMVLAGKKLLDLNQTQESAERKLIEIYKTRMGVNKEAAKSTMELASAIQKQGVIGDEVTLTGAQQLATYAKMPATVNKLLPAMDNLLVQQKGYNATADDAKNIANLFGKAMMGQTGALKRVGISFDEEQEKVLKYGTEEEKAAMLAEVVTQNVGNMNKVFAQTDEGKMQQVKNSLGDFGERLGHVLLPVLGKVASFLNDSVLPAIESVVAFIENHPVVAKIAVAIAAILAIAGPLLVMIGTLVSAIGSIMTILPALAGPVGIVIAIIAALIAIGIVLYKNWDTIKAKAAALRDGIVSAFNGLKGKVSSIWNGIKTAMVTPIQNAFNRIKNFITKLKNIFSKLKLKLPKFKLPHFSVKGGKAPFGLGGKGSMPSISVKWYKQGGIFDNPSLVGIGEAGPEAVVPLSGSQMQPFAKAIADNMNGGGIDYERLGSVMAAAMQNAAFEAKLYIDGKELTTVIAPMMRKRINTLDNRDLRKQGVLVGV